ncbi:hypothetical protein WJX81_004254 [Elliptochloris bilobata]|uniref:PAS domain-containing protein n=1 Tax=Elliptochloris bilobata TaxID=381761 RepID=A0AAW1SE30_9CHLO
MERAIAVLCPQKTLELGAERNRASFADYLERELSALTRSFPSGGGRYERLCGGGVAAEQGGPSLAVEGRDYVAAFSGQLENYAYLVKKYCGDVKGNTCGADADLDTIRQQAPLSEAEVLCHLYVQLGTDLLTKLKGDFAFVLYNAKLVRVFAACSAGGSHALQQVRMPDGSLLIATALAEGALRIPAGWSKYGWQADPQPWAKPPEDLQRSASQAAAAARRALAGIALRPRSASEASARAPALPFLSSGSSNTPRSAIAGFASPGPACSGSGGRLIGTFSGGGGGGTSTAGRLVGSLPAGGGSGFGGGFGAGLDGGVRGDAAARTVVLARSASEAGPGSDGAGDALPGGAQETAEGIKKTRRGKRGGRNQRERASLDGRLSLDSRISLDGRLSLDGRPSLDLQPRSSMDARRSVDLGRSASCRRADEHEWWRSGATADAAAADAGAGAAEGASLSLPAGSAIAAPAVQTPPEPAAPAAPRTPVTPLTPTRDGEALPELLAAALRQLPAEVLAKLAGPYREDPASAAMLASLLAASPCALAVADAAAPDHPALFVNAVWQRRTGYAAADALGRNLRFLQAPPGKARIPSYGSMALRRAMDAGHSAAVRLLNYAKDGTPLWNQLSVLPLRDATGAITHYVGMPTFTPAAPGMGDGAAALRQPSAAQRRF